jgi:hypothetical protein
MKMAVPNLSKDAVLAWLLDHCEKLLGGIVLLLAVWLAWGGLSAVRSKSAPADLKPDKIVSQAAAALTHIDRQQEPPDDKLLESVGLEDSVQNWISPAEKEPRKLVLSRPLFDELARRTRPEVFPVEDLQAVAGVAVLAAPLEPEAAGGRQPGPRGRPPRLGFDPLAGGLPGDLPPDQQPDPAENVPPARIVPYVIVTGLIPYAKQFTDYLARFENASFRDPQRDAPLWSDFLIERADVTNGPAEKWERINPKALMQAMQKEWAGLQPDSLPAEFFLSPEEQPGLGDIAYAWPLPQLAMEAWGPEAVHPWATAAWDRMVAEQAATVGVDRAAPMQPAGPTMLPFGSGGQLPPGFGNPLGGNEFGMEPLFDPLGGPDGGVTRLDYKLFRFVDTAVKVGRSYRYRVRVSVWNPNYQVPAQHLADAELAKATKLPSPSSNETEPVAIPGALGVLARLLPTEPKRGTAEVLVLWPHAKTGNYALHSVATEPGGIVSVQRKIEREDDDRARGRPVRGKQEPTTEPVPVGMLIDFMGQQAAAQPGPRLPAGRRGKKTAAPAEPFELLVLGDDGQLKWTNPIDSEERYRLYANTLPAELRGLPANQMGPDGLMPDPTFPGFK